MPLKFKLIGFLAIFLMFIMMFLTACNSNTNKENNSSIVTGVDYNNVIEQGLQNQGISLQDILYEETVGENKIIFFTSQNALGLAYMSKDRDGWRWERFTPFYDFESHSNPPSPYMASGKEIETPDGLKYYLAMGKIFDPDIVKLTINNDSINAIVKKKDDNIFWFKLLDNRDLYGNIKVYDKDGNELKESATGTAREKFQPGGNIVELKNMEEDLYGDGNKEKIVFYRQDDEEGWPVAWTIVVDGYEMATLDGQEGVYTLADFKLQDVDGQGGPEVLFYRYNTGTSGAKGLNIFKPDKDRWDEMFDVPNPFDMDKERFEMNYLGDYRVSFKDKETGLEHTIELEKSRYNGIEEMLEGIGTWVDPIAEYRIDDIDGDGVSEITTIQTVIGISHVDAIALLQTVYRLRNGVYQADKVMLTTYSGGFLTDTEEVLAEKSL